MSAIQKYKQEAQDLAKRVKELESQNHILTVTNAWLTCLVSAGPSTFGLIDADMNNLEPELALNADKVSAAKQVLVKQYTRSNLQKWFMD